MRRPLETVEAEGLAVSHLADRGLRMARPLARIDGKFAGAFDLNGVGEPAIAYEHLTGAGQSNPTASQAEALGEMVAELHANGLGADHLPLAEPIVGAMENVASCRPMAPRN